MNESGRSNVVSLASRRAAYGRPPANPSRVLGPPGNILTEPAITPPVMAIPQPYKPRPVLVPPAEEKATTPGEPSPVPIKANEPTRVRFALIAACCLGVIGVYFVWGGWTAYVMAYLIIATTLGVLFGMTAQTMKDD